MRKEGINSREVVDEETTVDQASNHSLDNGTQYQNAKNKQYSLLEEKQTVYRWFWFDKYLMTIGIIVMLLSQLYFSLTIQKINKEERKIDYITEGFMGFEKDNSDSQWRAYSENFGLMVIAIIIFCLLSQSVRIFFGSAFAQHTFYIVFGVPYLIFLFRGNFLFWLFFTGINFLLIEVFYKFSYFPLLIWTVNLITIYTNDTYHGYNLVTFFHLPALQYLQDTTKDQLVGWHSVFNMTILRMISFGMDKHWAFKNKRFIQQDTHFKKCKQCQLKDPSSYCLKYRYDDPSNIKEFTLQHYFSYLVYTPLFITGPPLTFNAFISQINNPGQVRKSAFKYSLRALFSYFCFEMWLHFDYSFAITTKSQNAWLWERFSPAFFFICSFSSLVFIWFKFNTIWKVARAWAMWDNIEAPENMNRCIYNNYNFEGFWRSWHRGFNQWLLRYIYFPLGGSKTKLWNIWVVFTFVAIWHDLKLNLLLWAWGICICLIPEIGVKKYLEKQQFKKYTTSSWWKYLCAICASFYIIFMCYTNLIGFGMGWDTINMFLNKSFSTITGLLEFLQVVFILALVSLSQFLIREHEDDPDKGF
ncbi:hypothetical protein ABPG72_008780 [Tetrahymena utriculariae]